MSRVIKFLFFLVVVKPTVLILLGLNLRGRDRLPAKGPAIIVANHNSHLDTFVLMSLFPLSRIHQIRPVAAADYFFGNGKLLAWIATRCIDIVPLDRSGKAKREDLFKNCHESLDQDQILIVFPEGSRGRPEQLSRLRRGVHYLVKERTDVPVIPVCMHGLGHALPKGEALFVPFNCDVVAGDPIPPAQDSGEFLSAISDSFNDLSKYLVTRTQS